MIEYIVDVLCILAFIIIGLYVVPILVRLCAFSLISGVLDGIYNHRSNNNAKSEENEE